MTPAKLDTRDDGANRIIVSLQDAEQSALEAVRRFVDTVDGAFPDVGEVGTRKKILDAAFKMTEQLVTASNRLAQRIVTVTENALDEFETDARDAREPKDAKKDAKK